MRIADPNRDNGAFSSLTMNDIMSWLKALGNINEVDPRITASRNAKEQREIAIEHLRLALYDMQRLDYLFPDSEHSKVPNFKISRLESWPKWKEPHPEIRAGGLGTQKVDGFKDAKRMKSYVMVPFNLLAFTQPEMVKGLPMTPPSGPAGNWIGVKKIMGHVSLDITGEGGRDTPFVIYFYKDVLLIMEILDVKRISWPEPGPKFFKQLQGCQELKFGADPGAPLVPMMETPKVPLVLVRYSYMEGRPECGSQFVLHLESRLREILPNASDSELRVELEKRMASGEEMPEEHLRMFARLLSYNADFVDREWVDDQQSHWNIPKEVKKETRISFFVPCLRPRFRAVEEIETGKKPIPYTQCGKCNKDAKKTMCGSCRAVCYCSPDCATAHWPEHKADCKISKKIISEPSSLPPDTLYIPVRAFVPWVTDFGFASEQEAVKMGGPVVGENPRNEYGAKRFICRALMPNAGTSQWDPHQAKMVFYGRGAGTAVFFDRRRSVMVRLGPQEPAQALQQGIVIPFHDAGYQKFTQVVQKRGIEGQLLYVWVRRVGDCIEIDLKDIPDQRNMRWD
ncbi:hypothetical protein DFH07DRAFT_731156 [Mycena maculata]|uniref:MYND-type domain-containing protein n=1 Tax=Mycena maculata TaxID=230809 RepID=A0AAD7K3V1_9AGAR|nr:hypothetical protein DFH07DRAFT_731156 [Mycena maculata]